MDLAVQNREKFGKAVRSLRRAGFIPAELYGHGVKNTHLSVAAKDFLKVFKEAGTNTVVNLLIGEEKHPANGGTHERRPALIYEIKRNYLTGEIAHVDFYQVRMDEKIKAKIPLEFTGEAPAVREKAAILNKAMAEIEVEALPADLPHRFEVDLKALDDLNKSVYVKDINVPRGVKILIDPETVVVTATPPVAEEVKVEAPVDVSAVKVEDEEKKAERQAEKVSKEEKTEKAKG